MNEQTDILWSCVPSAIVITMVLIGFFALCFYMGVSALLASVGAVPLALVMAKTAANRLGSRR